MSGFPEPFVSPFGDDLLIDAGLGVDHVAAALGRLCQQFRDKQGIVDLLTIFADRYNGLERAIYACLTMRNIRTAQAAQLDVIGRIVGQSRNGMFDADYRRYIFARIATNRSNGRVEDLIRVARLVVNDNNAYVQIDQQGIASVVVRIRTIAVTDAIANVLVDFLQAAAGGGVRAVIETQYVTDDDQWTFALAAFGTGAVGIGDVTLAVDSTAGFPLSGSLVVDPGLAGEDTITYTGTTLTSFIGIPPSGAGHLVHTHVSGTEVSSVQTTKGMGDTSNPATGGELASARVAYYP